MKNSIPNVRKISDFDNDANMRDIMWQEVIDALNTVLTLDKVNQKPLQRTGKVMQKALNELFYAIGEYGDLRKKV